ncbi:MAG: adenosylmethionine decarboxylase [Lentisphaeria bacterium]|nr:adenosylmethionine decarboxylase [Lentisphaeria bacterium]
MYDDSAKLRKHDYALGRQLTVEFYDCNSESLADAKVMEKIFLQAAAESGATIISSNFHGFEPQGVSGVVIIAESHFTVHAWPEHDYAAVDIFTCGEKISFQKAIDSLKEQLKADHVIVSSLMNRGIVNNNGMERLVPIFEDTSHRYTLSWERRFNETCARALLVSVDVYNIFDNAEFDESKIDLFTEAIIRNIKIFKPTLQVICDKIDNDGKIVWLLNISDGLNSLRGKFFTADNSAYIDVFSCIYFEPRVLGELAVKELCGTNYRMQVAIRQ